MPKFQLDKDIIDRAKANVARVEDAGLSTMLISTYLLKDLLDIAEASQQIADGTSISVMVDRLAKNAIKPGAIPAEEVEGA